VSFASRTGRGQGAGLLLLRVVTAAALAVVAYTHADLASQYDGIQGSISQGTLFVIEAAAASFAALIVLVFGGRIGFALAALVAASALGAILLYRYVDVGTLGPLPNMYEPVWYPEKTTAAIAAAVATLAAVIGLAWSFARRPGTAGRQSAPAGQPAR